MVKLDSTEFKRVAYLIKSENELSVFSVINGIMDGEVYVNNVDHPTAALIKTSECNLITGSADDAVFNSQVSLQLDFWDQLTPDSSQWINKIPTIHKNSHIRQYTRRHYVLSPDGFIEWNGNLMEGYVIEKVDLTLLRQKSFENSEKLLNWVENWGNDENFEKYGTGYFLHNSKVIVSWSLSDCSFGVRTAIGVHTDERYRNNGFGRIVVSATIKDCFAKGYQEIDWLCVDSNKSSISIADKLGFTYNKNYPSFSSYPPIESPTDLSETEWHEWGEYLEHASKTEECLLLDCLYSYVKSNDIEKTISIMATMQLKKVPINYIRLKNYIVKLQTYGMCSNFHKKAWIDFLKENTL